MLIDESLPEQLEPFLIDVETSTVRRERLKGLRNGVLLRAAVDRGFTMILSADQSLRYQQNLSKIGIGAVVVSGVRSRMRELTPLVPQILEALSRVQLGEVVNVSPKATSG
ncbi:MAG TPA: hypothetical protein VE974_13220 [Thermoanaerobaculia bacterium]|nr:hypothetical protein [Thermoanaerobaculia bacterium]